MDLPSFFRRKTPASQASPALRGSAEPTAQDARIRARRRLIGAIVLLGVGVIAFPLLFETEPRPIPVDLPIDIPRKEGAPPLAPPAPAATAPAAAQATTPPASRATEPAVQAPAPAPALLPAAPAEAPAAAPPATAAPAKTPAPARPTDEAARAQALLEGRAASPAAKAATAAPATEARFVVQVGAFAEERAVRDVRAKVERLGLKTFTQVVKLPDGDRTRVRVGPFSQREDAEAVAAQLKKAGLPGSVLTL